MTEIKCPLRVEELGNDKERLVRGHRISRSCSGCIATARTSPLALRESTRLDPVRVKAWLEARDPTQLEQWNDTGIRCDYGLGRKVIERSGLKTRGSGDESIRTHHMSICFDCTHEADKTVPTELNDEFGNDYWRRIIRPDDLTLPTGRYDPLVKSKFYRPLQEGRYEIMLAAVKITADSLNKNDKGHVAAEDQSNEDMVRRLLAIVSDMPVDVPVEHRLLIWQAIFDADELLVAEHVSQTSNAIYNAHQSDPALITRLENVYNATIDLKLERLGQMLGTPVTLEDLDLMNLQPQSATDHITKYFPEALTILEALAVLEISIKPTIEQILADDMVKKVPMIH